MIQPFGILLTIYLAKNILFTKKLKTRDLFGFLFTVLVFLELFVNVGYFLKVGNYEFLYDEFVLVLLLIVSMVAILKNMNNIRLRITMLIFVASILITEIFLAFNPIEDTIFRNGEYIVPTFSMYSVLVTSKVLIMLTISIVALKYIDKTKIDILFDRLLKYVSFMYGIILIEWITKNIFKSNIFHTVINYIFGRGQYTVDFLLERGSGYSLQGLQREPAGLSFGLFMFLIILIFSNAENKKKNRYFIIGIIFLVLSGSLSGAGYALALVVCYMINSKRKIKPVFYVLSLAVVFILVVPKDLLTYYTSRIINSINILGLSNQITEYTSEHVRLFSIQETLRTVFIKRPLFGAGLGIPYSYSATVMLISSIGVIGGLAWFSDYFLSIGKIKSLKKFLIIIVMLGVLIFIGSIKIVYSGFVLFLALQMRYQVTNEIIHTNHNKLCVLNEDRLNEKQCN